MKKFIQVLIYAFILLFLSNCQNPTPGLVSISPDIKPANFPTFILTVNGYDFLSDSVIVFDGTPKTTTFIDSSQLTCEINPADIAIGGVSVPVLVNTPLPGGGDSTTLNFAISTDPIFTQPINLSNSGTTSTDPDIASDRHGNLNIIWSEVFINPNSTELYFIRSDNKGKTWNTSQNITMNNQYLNFSDRPAIAVDMDDVLNIVWQWTTTCQGQNINFSRSSSGNNWTTPVFVSGAINIDQSQLPDIAIDHSNNIFACWRELFPTSTSEIYVSRSTDFGVNWSPPVNLTNNQTRSLDSCLAAGSSGTVYVVWTEVVSARAGTSYYIYFSRSSDYGVTWSTASKITNTGYSNYPRIAVDSSGHLHVVFYESISQTNRVVYYFKSVDKGTTWNTPVDISKHSTGTQNPDIVIDSADNINVVWQEAWSVNGGNVYFCRSIDHGQIWSQPINLSNSSVDSSLPEISVDTEGNIYIVWEERMEELDKWEIFFTRAVY